MCVGVDLVETLWGVGKLPMANVNCEKNSIGVIYKQTPSGPALT